MFNDIIMYVGKTVKDDPTAYHPLVYHCLDVAAVGQALLEADRRLWRRYAGLLGSDQDRTLGLLLFLLGLHDLGKFLPDFQAMFPDLHQRLRGAEAPLRFARHHSDLGWSLWNQGICPRLLKVGLFIADDDQADLAAPLLQAVFGHHGRPPQEIDRNVNAPKPDTEAAWEHCQAIHALFLPHGVFAWEGLAPGDYNGQLATLNAFSWTLTGFCSLCDWLGSSTDYFPAHDPARRGLLGLEKYFRERALPQARQAVAHSGLVIPAIRPGQGFADLFPDKPKPRPLQAWADGVAIPAGPQLYILEDATGSGKTEAALTLAYRLLEAGHGEGLFVALPTMATANAMYARVGVAYRLLFAEDSAPNLILAHGRRALSKQFRRSMDQPEAALYADPSPDGQDGQEESAAHCASWLADNTKKALLGAVGVGTVDQAMLAVMPVKYQSLRLFGLSRSVLIVDEVHAYDAYMRAILATLLRFHAARGGSAILLSATLPENLRQELIRGFAKGLGVVPPPLPENLSYPLAMRITAGKPLMQDVAPASRPPRIRVDYLSDHAEVLRRIRQVVAAGGCVAWVRNTVADAVEGARAVREVLADLPPLVEGERVTLFHARFALADRLDIEQAVIRRFGKESVQEERQGRVVVATQVIEQSLDLDFDLMVSDLAPIELLIQRAGRGWRHARSWRPDLGEGQSGPVLLVYGPEMSDTPLDNWYKGFFPNGAGGIYPLHGRLWLTARLLTERGGWTMPDDARMLLSSVYGDAAGDDMPEALHRGENRANGKDLSAKDMGKFNSLPWEPGYVRSPKGFSRDDDGVRVPTRLGEERVTVRLGRLQGGVVRPWAEGDDVRESWALSEVSVSVKKVCGEVQTGGLGRLLAATKAAMPDKGRYCLLVALEEKEGRFLGRGLGPDGREVVLAYDRSEGVVITP